MKLFVGFIILLSNTYTLNAQLSVPFQSLPIKAELRIKSSKNTEGVLYASIYTDTAKGCRVWLFHDTTKTQLELKSVLFEQFLKVRSSKNSFSKKHSSQYYLLSGQLFLTRDEFHIGSKNWETKDFLMDGYGPSDSTYLSFFKQTIQENFPLLISSLSKLFEKETLGAIRNFRIPPFGNLSVVALQLSPQNKNYQVSWLEIYYTTTGKASFSLEQFVSIGYDTERLIRKIKNDRLIAMSFQGFPGESFDRMFDYDNHGKLYQIVDGNKNEDGIIDNGTIISVVEIKN